MKLKSIIFDVDGVLVNSKRAHAALLTGILQAGGYPAPSEDELKKCFHTTLRTSIINLTKSTDEAEIDHLFALGKQPTMRHPELIDFPDKLEEILEKLHKKYKLAIVTSRIKIGMDEIFSAHNLRHFFDEVITYEDYSNPKPNPEPLEKALKRLDISPKEAVYIGDSPSDIDAATAAGMPCIYLAHTPHPNAIKTVHQFDELPSVIEALD